MIPRCPTLLIFLFLVNGCVSPPRQTAAPKFPGRLREPLGVRLTDLRPEMEKGNERNPDWIYFRTEGSGQTDLLLQYLGGALNALQACPAIEVFPPDAPDDAARVMLRIDYLKGYSRWPANVKAEGSTVSVEGAAEIRYRLLVGGKQVSSGRISEAPPPFLVPVQVIRRDNVRRVVQEALAHQFDQTTTQLLEELLWQLAADWPVKK